ncbi:hypothetical protein MSAN_00261900 [Mycena sanguinolenta]|uniref:Uncharacterized protein n=1 Tax=Mycena sanguinolenta TaxID=230812 RepID=A0A8H7DN10_9AGAR|nr:hypothetical protein MSAN_00261900 [Mycena sanguinolenta]
MRILLQETIPVEELVESHQRYTEFSDEFEEMYVQRRDTVRQGPGVIRGQWALERTIGNLGEELKQHSNPYANFSQRAIRCCQVNALKAIISDLEPEPSNLKQPRGSVDAATDIFSFGLMIPAGDKFGPDIAEEWRPLVVRSSRARLPNGQVVRSLWKEQYKTILRAARHVKVQSEDDDPEFAEILFFTILTIEEEERYVGVISLFGPPDPYLMEISLKTYWSGQPISTPSRSEVDRWFLMEKPGLKLASWKDCAEPDDPMDEDDA